VRSPRAEATGEQGEHYDPLFTYSEGDEAGYFAVSEESGDDAADVGPSGVGTSKGSPLASSSFGWTTEGSASEGGPAIRVVLPKISQWSLQGLMQPSKRLKRHHLLVVF